MANRDIFKAAGGYALKFVISPCDEKAKLKELIQVTILDFGSYMM